jgi:hypothetical protein
MTRRASGSRNGTSPTHETWYGEDMAAASEDRLKTALDSLYQSA